MSDEPIRAENRRLREALETIAFPATYIVSGKLVPQNDKAIARAALGIPLEDEPRLIGVPEAARNA